MLIQHPDSKNWFIAPTEWNQTTLDKYRKKGIVLEDMVEVTRTLNQMTGEIRKLQHCLKKIHDLAKQLEE